MVQKALSAVWLQAKVCDGASPKYSATCALTVGEVIQFIHWYMQFGCWAFAEIIQVSDQPVAPSLGTVVATVTFLSPLIVLAITCHEEPMSVLED